MNASTHRTQDHLTDDQIDDYLMGDLAAGPAAHLAACDPCTQRVAEAQAPLVSFQAVSLAWSERRSATMAALPAARKPAWQPRAAWATVATAALALAVALPALNGHRSAAPTSSAQAASPVAEPAARPVAVAATGQARPAETTASHAPVLMASTGRIETLSPDEEIRHDNQLLRAVDYEISAPSDTPSLLGPQPEAPVTPSPTGGAALFD